MQGSQEESVELGTTGGTQAEVNVVVEEEEEEETATGTATALKDKNLLSKDAKRNDSSALEIKTDEEAEGSAPALAKQMTTATFLRGVGGQDSGVLTRNRSNKHALGEVKNEFKWRTETDIKDSAHAIGRLPPDGLGTLTQQLFVAILTLSCLLCVCSLGLALESTPPCAVGSPCRKLESDRLLVFASALVFCGSLLLWREKKLQDFPMSPSQLLKRLFAGLPPGSIMFSYAWYGKTSGGGQRMPLFKLPRALERCLPRTSTWIDVRNLVPGDDTTAETAAAASQGAFCLVFLSEAYMESAACRIEWEQIIQKPANSFVLVPVQTFDFGKWEGRLPEGTKWEDFNIARGAMAAAASGRLSEWFLAELIHQGAAQYLMTHKTPAIYENWKYTCESLVGHLGAVGIIRKYPSLVTGSVFLFLLYQIFDYCFNVPSRAATTTVVLSFVVTLLLLAMIVIQLRLGRYGLAIEALHRKHFIPQAAWLLATLVKLGVCKPLAGVLVSRNLQKKYASAWKILKDTGACTFLPDTQEGIVQASFAVVCLDEQPRQVLAGLPSANFVYWSDRPFSELKNSGLSKAMQSSFIHQGLPSATLVATRLLLLALNCPKAGLTSGHGSFAFTKRTFSFSLASDVLSNPFVWYILLAPIPVACFWPSLQATTNFEPAYYLLRIIPLVAWALTPQAFTIYRAFTRCCGME